MRRLSEKLPFSNSSKTNIHMNSYDMIYRHFEAIAGILMSL